MKNNKNIKKNNRLYINRYINRALAILAGVIISIAICGCGDKKLEKNTSQLSIMDEKQENSDAQSDEARADAATDEQNIDENKVEGAESDTKSEDEDVYVADGGNRPARINRVYVSTTAELLDAIESDTEIVLKAGTYNLTYDMKFDGDKQFQDFQNSHDKVYLSPSFEGFEMSIIGVKSLSIVAETQSAVRILTEPRYADVFNFQNSSDIYLEGITFGHTPDKGSCEGAVLEFDDCQDIELKGVDLFGCGTYGITFYDIENLQMSNSIIRECSYGLLEGNNGRNLVFSNCDMVDCSGYTMFDFQSSDAVFENCRFDGNIGEFGLFPYQAGTNSLTYKECKFGRWESACIEELSYPENARPNFENCEFVESEQAFPYTDDCGNVHVVSVEQFVEAVEPNAIIVFEPGVYNLTDYINSIADIDWWNNNHTYINITEVYDGYELNIENADGIILKSQTMNRNDVEIVTEARYAGVLNFISSDDTFLYELTIGHTIGSECVGNVINYYDCSKPSMTGMDLYGCGVYGVGAYVVDSICISDSRIHDCSEGPFEFEGIKEGGWVSGCVFENNGGWFYMNKLQKPITFERCAFGQIESISIKKESPKNAKLIECVVEEVNDYYYYD